MIYFNENLKLSYKQLDNVYNTAFSIIESLPNKAVNQLLTAYNGDIDALLTEIFRQTDSVLTLNRTLETEKLSYIEQLGESMDDTLKIHSYNYFKTTVLNNFRQGWRNLEWGNLIQLYQNSAYLAARSHGKCFIRGTRILMADFTVKNVEDIYPGMEVMGIDYTPRKVLTRHIGFSDMYRIEQEGGMAYAVNAPHILCLFDSKKKEYVEIEAEKYYSLTPLRRKRFKGYRVFSPDTPVLEKMDIVIEPIGKESYYGFMTDGDHLFQLEDGTVVHNSYEFCFAFPLWRLYSYRRPNYMKPDTPDNKNRQETCIITNTETLGKEHVDKIVEEIKANDILCHVINPNGKAVLAEKSVEGENGTKLHLRGAGGFIRGLHVGAAVSDDLPDESSIYSLEQRQKLENIFKGSISPIVEPYGYNIVDGTPYQSADLYDSLKKDDKFKVFEYPAVFPDGRLLAPDRFTFEKLMAEKESAGSLVFSREYLVVPISDDSTIFPWDILKRSTIGMENVRLVNNQESFPYKLDAVAVGVDFGISGAVGADYTCFTVWGRDKMGIYYLLHLYRAKGMPYDEQVQRIITLNTIFRPNAVVVENNNFQSVLGSLAIDGGVKNIIRFTTTNNKKDLRSGWPSLAALFERGVIKVPYHHDDRDKINMLFGEFNSVAFRSDKGTLESISGHDDTLSSSYMAINYLREGNVQIKIDTV